MGAAVSEAAAKLFAANEYQQYLLLHGLGVEMAEALAEYWHRRIREEWGFVAEDGPTIGGLFRQQYRGGRYSWGYPACPDLEDNATVARLLGAERLGIEVSEETGWQYQPEQTTSALHLPPPPGQVLRRPLAILTTVGSAERNQLSSESDQASLATASRAGDRLVGGVGGRARRHDETVDAELRERLRPLRCQPATRRHRDLERSEVGRPL